LSAVLLFVVVVAPALILFYSAINGEPISEYH
jgi:hypothetical protein